MTVYGIDPAFRKSGFTMASINSDKVLGFRVFNSFVDFVEWVYQNSDLQQVLFIVENSNLQNVTFDKRGGFGVASRKSRNVGSNQAVSQIAVELLERKFGKENVLPVSPKEKGVKLSQQGFEILVRQHKIIFPSKRKKVSQDKRDAFSLALQGMKIIH